MTATAIPAMSPLSDPPVLVSVWLAIAAGKEGELVGLLSSLCCFVVASWPTVVVVEKDVVDVLCVVGTAVGDVMLDATNEFKRKVCDNNNY